MYRILLLTCLILFCTNSFARSPQPTKKKPRRGLIPWDLPSSNCKAKYGYGPIVFNEDTEREHAAWVADLDPVCRSRYESY